MKLHITFFIGVFLLAGCAGQPTRTSSPAPGKTRVAVIPERAATAAKKVRPAAPPENGDEAENEPEMSPKASVATVPKPGGYYLDDGPDASPPPNLDDIPDAVPKYEPPLKYTSKTYMALGKTYTPAATGKGYKAKGVASWYGRRFHGKRTASGERYDMYAMSAAHPTLPLPSYVRVTSLENGKSIVVRVNDRGPFHNGRIIDLSYTAAHKLGIVQSGKGRVEVESITPEEIAVEHETAGEPGTYLQIGSFSVRANAEKLLAYAATQLDSRTDELTLLDQSPRYRVVLGPYSDRDSVRQAARDVQKRMNLKPIRVVR